MSEKTYIVRTYGCQMNEHDSERIAGLLEADGLRPAAGVDDADVVVLNTCCIRENADNKLYGHLGRLKAMKAERPDMQIVVGGCLAQKDRDLIVERAPHVDVVLGTHNVGRAAELLGEQRSAGRSIVEILEETAADDHESFPSALPARREVPYAGWVTIQIGCDNSCAFCIVPAVRGREISRTFDDVVGEVEALAVDGVTEVTLLGQNVNSYGRDLTLARRQAGDHVRVRPLFADLLRAVGGVDGIRRVRYTSPHPKDLRPETIAAMAEVPEVCEHLHLPLQAGSDRVLAAMHRGYTAERYLERLAAARAAMPDLAVTTDIIVGFPGETDDDFERTLEVTAEAGYDSAYTFIYSPRPGTEAAERVDEFVPRRGHPRALRAVAGGGRALGAGPPPGAGRHGGRGHGRGALPQGPRDDHRAHRAQQAGPLRVARAAAGGHLRDGPRHGRGAPPPHRRPHRGHGAGPAPHADPGGLGVSAAGGVADPQPVLEITAEPFDAPVSQALVGALMDDLDERYAADGAGDGDSHEMMAQFTVRAHQVTPPVGIFLVAWLDGEPAGCGAVRRVIGGPAEAGEIKRMYTVPAARRRGVSRALLARLEAEAAALGYASLQLETGLRQPEAIALYEAAGYHRIPSYGQYEGDELSVCFAKDLAPLPR